MILNIYSNKWRHFDPYTITKTENGWNISFILTSHSGLCDKGGHPFLYKNLDHDCISYPEDLSQRLENIWEDAELNQYNSETIQLRLDELSEILKDFEIENPLP